MTVFLEVPGVMVVDWSRSLVIIYNLKVNIESAVIFESANNAVDIVRCCGSNLAPLPHCIVSGVHFLFRLLPCRDGFFTGMIGCSEQDTKTSSCG
jgi:hypothetical protein